MLVASPIAGIYADRHGSRALAAIGMLVTAAGLAAMTTLGVHTPYWQSGAVAADRGRRLGDVQQPQHGRDDGRGARPSAGASPPGRGRCCRTPGRCCRSPSCSRSSPPSIPKARCSRSSPASPRASPREKLAPFISNMHVALWVLAATSAARTPCACCARATRHPSRSAERGRAENDARQPERRDASAAAAAAATRLAPIAAR